MKIIISTDEKTRKNESLFKIHYHRMKTGIFLTVLVKRIIIFFGTAGEDTMSFFSKLEKLRFEFFFCRGDHSILKADSSR